MYQGENIAVTNGFSLLFVEAELPRVSILVLQEFFAVFRAVERVAHFVQGITLHRGLPVEEVRSRDVDVVGCQCAHFAAPSIVNLAALVLNTPLGRTVTVMRFTSPHEVSHHWLPWLPLLLVTG